MLDPKVEELLTTSKISPAYIEAIEAALVAISKNPRTAATHRLDPDLVEDLYARDFGVGKVTYRAWDDWPLVYVLSIAWTM